MEETFLSKLCFHLNRRNESQKHKASINSAQNNEKKKLMIGVSEQTGPFQQSFQSGRSRSRIRRTMPSLLVMFLARLASHCSSRQPGKRFKDFIL